MTTTLDRNLRRTVSLLTGLALFTGAAPSHAENARVPEIAKVCTPCHGPDGSGGDVQTPSLAGQSGIYLRNQLLAFRTGTRKHPDMKGIARDLTDREIDQVVLYYSLRAPR